MSTNSTTVIYFALSVVMARLLSPEEIGIYSITAVMVSVAHLFRDFGVASYLQQTRELTREKVGAALGMLICTSWTIALLTYLFSGPAAAFYGHAGIRDVMQVLALGFVFIPFGAITNSLLTRDFRAKEQAYVRLVGTLTYAATALTLALQGHSYMSMAWANLANIIVAAIAYLPYRPAIAPWLPRFRGWRGIARFGAGATLGSGLQALNDGLPDIVLGKLGGPRDVGLLNRAIGTTGMLNRIIGPTIEFTLLPYLSKAHHGGQAMNAILARASAYLTCLMWPAFAATAMFSEPLIRLLFGVQWLEAAPLVRYSCLMFALTVPFSFLSTAYVAIGRPHLGSLPSAISIVMRGLAIALAYDGTLHSFALGLVVAAFASYPVEALLQRHFFRLGLRQFLASQHVSLHVTAWCGAVAGLAGWVSQSWPDAARLALAAVAVIPVWATAVWVLRHPLRHELENLVRRFPQASSRLLS